MELKRISKEDLCRRWAKAERKELMDNSLDSRFIIAQEVAAEETYKLLVKTIGHFTLDCSFLEDHSISLSFEGERFNIKVCENPCEILIELSDAMVIDKMDYRDYFEKTRETVNWMNQHYPVQVYTNIFVDDDSGDYLSHVVYRRQLLFIKEIPSLVTYLRAVLEEFFMVHRKFEAMMNPKYDRKKGKRQK